MATIMERAESLVRLIKDYEDDLTEDNLDYVEAETEEISNWLRREWKKYEDE